MLERPISYYYHDFRVGAAAQRSARSAASPRSSRCRTRSCGGSGSLGSAVSAFLAWIERNRGYALLVVAYFLQWLPVDRLAAHRVRVPFLPEPRDHRAGNADRVADACGTALAVPAGALGRRMASASTWLASFLGILVFLSGPRRGRQPYDAWHQRMWSRGCISASTGFEKMMSGHSKWHNIKLRRAKPTRSAARCSPSSAKRSFSPPRAVRPIPRRTTA